jgi:mannobiose 2-epimerase
LWAFSAAYNNTGKEEYKQIAVRAYEYISQNLMDKKYGGIYWTVDFKGHPLDTKKQIYALSFAIYGLSEYYKIDKNENALNLSISLYKSIVKYSYDKKYEGYIEALTRDWKEIEDLRLSTKDANERKSMNTHLHILEAFANLYKVWPHKDLRYRIKQIIHNFLEYIIDKETGHLALFFDDQWKCRSTTISYGHDIEAAWLIQEAAEIINDQDLLPVVKERSVLMAKAVVEGLDKDGGLWYECEPETKHLVRQKHWWPQAEAIVGFFNAWQITGEEKYLEYSLNSWKFIDNYILDKNGGEWIWGINEEGTTMYSEDKVGIWKCPYHNSRACIEIMNRIDRAVNNEKN